MSLTKEMDFASMGARKWNRIICDHDCASCKGETGEITCFVDCLPRGCLLLALKCEHCRCEPFDFVFQEEPRMTQTRYRRPESCEQRNFNESPEPELPPVSESISLNKG